MKKELKMSTILSSIRDFFKRVGHFIKNMWKLFKMALFNKVKYKTVDEAINGYSFDFGYLYNLELAKLKEMVDYFTKYGISADNDKYIRQMKLAIKLLTIVNNEGGFHYEWLTDGKGNIVDGNFSDTHVYVCDVKVNTKNADRFVRNEKEKDFYINRYPHELYLLKAKYLYHKLRNDFEQTWWD